MAKTDRKQVAPPPAWRGLVLPGVLVVIALAILVSLGNWQMRRLAWKEALIARVDQRIDAPAIPAPGPEAWPGLTEEAVDYLHVTLSGRFLDGEFHVYTALADPRGSFGGPGYWIVSPFETEAGWIVFVNRGFVPDGRKEQAERPGSGAPQGTVSLDATIRRAEPPQFTTPDPDRAKNVWFVRDPAMMADALGIDAARVAPYTLDLRASHGAPGQLPQPGESMVSFNNPHLGYAFTWYGLALAALGVFAVFAAGRLRRRG